MVYVGLLWCVYDCYGVCMTVMVYVGLLWYV